MKLQNKKLSIAILAAILGSVPIAVNAEIQTDPEIINHRSPRISFNDTDPDDTDWEICIDGSCTQTSSGISNVDDEFAIMSLDPDFDGTRKKPIAIQKTARNHALYMTGNNIGMGTATPQEELHIVAPSLYGGLNPANSQPFWNPGTVGIRLQALGGSNNPIPIFNNATRSYELNVYGGLYGGLTIENTSLTGPGIGQKPFKIGANASDNSLVVGGLLSSNIGIGTNNPLFDLHIKRDNANIFVQDTNAATPSGVLMELSKNGIPAFRLTNTATSTSWDFSQRDDKRLVISLAGSGGFEYTIEDSGNSITRGSASALLHINTSSREAKTDFEAVNTQEVMDKIKSMEVSEWRYKDTAAKGRHIGPVAEEFYSLFKLGADDKHIAASDIASIALIAAKELQKKSFSTDAETAALKSETVTLKGETASLKEENTSLKARLASLEKLVTNLALGQGLLPEKGDKVVLK